MTRHKNKKHDTANSSRYEYEHRDEDSVDIDTGAKGYPVMEHISNARLMPMTGPYGRLDLQDTYEYGTVPESPSTPLESYEVVMDKNAQKNTGDRE